MSCTASLLACVSRPIAATGLSRGIEGSDCSRPFPSLYSLPAAIPLSPTPPPYLFLRIPFHLLPRPGTHQNPSSRVTPSSPPVSTVQRPPSRRRNVLPGCAAPTRSRPGSFSSPPFGSCSAASQPLLPGCVHAPSSPIALTRRPSRVRRADVAAFRFVLLGCVAPAEPPRRRRGPGRFHHLSSAPAPPHPNPSFPDTSMPRPPRLRRRVVLPGCAAPTRQRSASSSSVASPFIVRALRSAGLRSTVSTALRSCCICGGPSRRTTRRRSSGWRWRNFWFRARSSLLTKLPL